MNFLKFKEQMFELACFNLNQIYAWDPNFNRNNLGRWIKKKYLIRLRQGFFSFPEYKNKPDYFLYFANRIYKPSYISLHTALAFYGMIPESVVQITSVTSLKTIDFKNDFGEYSYHHIKENLIFGYQLKSISQKCAMMLASPEKALLDLLYLYPFYNSEQELEELRLDEDFMQNSIQKEKLLEISEKFQNKALNQRLKLLFKVYAL